MTPTDQRAGDTPAEQGVVDLMAALEESVNNARAARDEARKARGMEPIVEHIVNGTWPEYTVRVTVPADVWWQDDGKPGFAKFEVFEVVACDDMEGNRPQYHFPGWTSSLERMTGNLDEAEVVAHGDVKWDGCVNYSVGTEDVMLHNCGPDDIGFFLQAIKRAYDIALDTVGGGL